MNSTDSPDLPDLKDGEVVERINKADLVPLWEPHDHSFVRGDEDTDAYYDEVCEVENCGMGRLILKA
jgi:hypothetical protein